MIQTITHQGPKFPGHTTKPLFTVILSPVLRRKIETVAHNFGCSQSEIIRTALYEYFARLDVLSEEAKREQAPDPSDKRDSAPDPTTETGPAGEGDTRGPG